VFINGWADDLAKYVLDLLVYRVQAVDARASSYFLQLLGKLAPA